MSDGIFLGQLQAFVEIARQENVTHAADALFLTQPALTSRLRRLEHQIGATLLIRDRRGARLTDAGRAFLPYAERAVATMIEAQRVVGEVVSGVTGDLIIGAASTLASFVLPPVIRKFSLANPGVHVTVRTALSEDVLDMVVRGTIQLGFARALQHPDVECVPLYDEEWLFAVHERHRLASKARISGADLASETFITVNRSASYQEFMQLLLRHAGFTLRSTIDLDNADTSKKMLSESLGVGILPRTAIAEELARGEFRRLTIVGLPPMTRRMAAMRLRRSAELSSVRELIRLLRDRLIEMGHPSLGNKPQAERARAHANSARLAKR